MNLDNESRLAMITYRQEKSVMALQRGQSGGREVLLVSYCL